MQDISTILNAALSHHQAGRLAEAKGLYEQILAVQPKQPDALHFLGLLACQVRQYEAGLALISQSIALAPTAVYYNNFGNMLCECGRLGEAIDSYRQAVTLKPDYPEAHNNLGNALREARQPQAAMNSCAQAIELRPGYAEAYNNLGNALQDLGELEAAAASYGKAVALKPAYAQAYNNLGNVQRTLGRTDDAIASYRQAVSLMPVLRVAHHGLGLALRERGDLSEAIASLQRGLGESDANAHNSLGCALRDAGQLDEAMRQFEAAVSIDPKLAIAHCNLAGAQKKRKAYEAAIASAQRALSLDPKLAEAYRTLGNAYHELEKFEAAEMSYRYALELDPRDAAVQDDLTTVLVKREKLEEARVSSDKAMSFGTPTARMHINLGDILRAQGAIDASADAYRKAIEVEPHRIEAYNRLLFNLAGSPSFAVDAFRKEATQFCELLAAHAKPMHHEAPASRETRRLRVGFVSGDLRLHPIGIFLESVLGHIDRARVELIAYPTCEPQMEDEITARLKPHFAAWRPLRDPDPEVAAKKIRADNIDVLVDLSGHTAFTGIPVFVWKPAPVQATWIGFFATTGCKEIDYVLGDRHVLPESEASHFIEKPWRLPDSYLCFTPPKPEVKIGPLPMLRNGGVTFGCFGKHIKVNDNVIAVWSRLLHKVPGSRLFLKAPGTNVKDIWRNAIECFASHGIGADRLILEAGSPRAEYLDAYNRVDITLSPFPYPGGTTTAEALWMGTPVLCMKGDRFVTHICESLLHTAGLEDWIANDEEDYIARAIAFASDRERLQSMRASLREQVLASPLCDAPRFARNLEDAFHGMWNAYCARSVKNAATV